MYVSDVLTYALADSPRFMGMASELDCWMMWIENSMADAAFDMPVIDDFDDFIGGKQIDIAPVLNYTARVFFVFSVSCILRTILNVILIKYLANET